MNDIVIAAIKERLLKRKAELEVELTRLSREQFGDRQSPDPSDQASASSLEDVNISLQNNEHDEYVMILKALSMIEAGTYGICIDCGQPISEKRLQLYPNVTRCLACQEAVEEKSQA